MGTLLHVYIICPMPTCACSQKEDMACGSPDGCSPRPSHYSLSDDDDDDWMLPSASIGGPHEATADTSITHAESDDVEEAIVAHVLAKSVEEKVPERFVIIYSPSYK